METIVLKALEKDPRRRYESVVALSQDIDRHLASEPILARPPRVAYQVRKFAARNKVLVGGVLATVVVLAAGVLVSSMLGIREVRHRRAAELSRAEAERTGYVAGVAAAEAGLRLFELGEVKRRLAACPPALRGWEWEHLSFRSDMSEKVVAGHAWRVYAVAASPDGRLYASGAGGILGTTDPRGNVGRSRTFFMVKTKNPIKKTYYLSPHTS